MNMTKTEIMGDAVNRFLGCDRRSVAEIARTGVLDLEEAKTARRVSGWYGVSYRALVREVVSYCRAQIAAEGA